jgi:hypothetical protein
MTLTVQAHLSASYSPRTYANAQAADLTAAFAVDFDTAGERLTRKAAKERYIAIPFGGDPVDAARALYRALRQHDAHTLNIAGNGIYTLSHAGWDQSAVNTWVYAVLATVAAHWPLTFVRSGGQTGVDIAGVAAAHALGIEAMALLPKGYLQRGTDKIDRQNTGFAIREQIEGFARELIANADHPSNIS